MTADEARSMKVGARVSWKGNKKNLGTVLEVVHQKIVVRWDQSPEPVPYFIEAFDGKERRTLLRHVVAA